MDIKKHHIKKTFILLVVVSVFLIFGNYAFAQQCEVIRIDLSGGGGGTEIILEPANLTVPLGTCTIWINFAKNRNMQISFREDAKSCMEAADDASGFEMTQLKTGESCYLSESLPYAGKSSMTWIKDPGEYKYTVEASRDPSIDKNQPSGKIVAEGVITVIADGKQILKKRDVFSPDAN